MPAQLPVLEAARRGSGRLVRHDGMWAVTVKAASEHLGFLVIGGVQDLDDPDRRTIERAGVVTALLLLFERAAADAEQRMRTDLVSDLVSGRGEPAVRVARARSQGLDLGEGHAVLVARGRPGEPRRALVMSAHAAVGNGALVGEHDGDVVALVPSADPHQCAGRVAARMGRSVEVTVGAAGPVSSVEDVPRAYADARRTTTALVRPRAHRHGRLGGVARVRRAGLRAPRPTWGRTWRACSVGSWTTTGRAAPTCSARSRRTTPPAAARGTPPPGCTSTPTPWRSGSSGSGSCSAPTGSSPEQSLELQLALRLRRLMPD